MRKNYLDNIRWITVWFVVAFHTFFYFNNIGTDAMFKFAAPYVKGSYTFAGIFQYFIYPWFMLLLFVVAGISSFYALKKRSLKEFAKERFQRLLVPSTLGLLTLGWLSGKITESQYQFLPDTMPGVIKYFIYCFMGTGALWFCQALFIISMVLLLVKAIDKNDKLQQLGSKANIIILVLLYFVVWGFAQILNLPKITTYRMGIYGIAFFLGYWLFSNDSVLTSLKKWWIPLLIAAIITGFFAIKKNYGVYYADVTVLQDWLTILFAWLMVLAIFGFSANFLDFTNKFTEYMKRTSFGVYVLHIPVMLCTIKWLTIYSLPLWLTYILTFAITVIGSLISWEILRHIPVIRFCLFGIKKKKNNNLTLNQNS